MVATMSFSLPFSDDVYIPGDIRQYRSKVGNMIDYDHLLYKCRNWHRDELQLLTKKTDT